MNSSSISNCVTVGLFELHTQAIINFTQFDFIKEKNSLPLYEIILKIILCLVSLVASLFGNIMVIYTILIKYKKKSPQCKAINGKAPMAKYQSRLLSPEVDNFAFLPRNANTSKQRVQKSLSLEIDRDNVRANSHSNQFYKTYKSKSVNYFILNLCFCDLMIVMWCSWVHMINSISQNWIFGAFFCKLNTFVQGCLLPSCYHIKVISNFKLFFQVMCLIAAISTLCLISLERFKGIVCTLGRKIDRKESIQAIIFIWLFSALAAFPIFIYRRQYKRIWKNHVEIWCSDAWPISYKFEANSKCIAKINEPFRRIYYTFISFVLFFIPIIIMLFSYCLIMRKLKRTKILKFIRENSYEKNVLSKRRQKVNVLLIGLIVSFTICWSPVQVFILYEAYKQFDGQEMPSWFNWVYFLVYLLAYSNSAINPIIYTGINRFYKKELRKIINNFSTRRRNTLQFFSKRPQDNQYK